MLSLNATDAFDKQMKQPVWRTMLDWIRHRCHRLLRMNDVVGASGFTGQHDLGLQVVPMEEIVGTVGRENDFDDTFRARRPQSRHRWVSVFQAQNEGKALPPIELYKVGHCYFVQDGHHRVSVGHANDQRYIDAHVIEIEPDENRAAHACVLEE